MREGPEELDAELTEGRSRRVAAALRGLAVDVTPLRASRDYRLLWMGQLVSLTGHQITIVAVFYQVYHLTRSAAAVGLIGAVHLAALMVTSIAGGGIIDAVDRRKLLILTQLGFATSSAILVAGALAGHPPVALVYGAAALAAGLSGLDSPTRSALTPILVGKELLASALALSQVMWNTTMVVGPAVGGLVIARFGLAAAYGIDLVTYGAAIAAVLLIAPRPSSGEVSTRPSGFEAIKEGFAYLKGRRLIQMTFAADLVAMIFGIPRALFPILAVTQFHRGPEAVGLLFAAPAAGALIGAATAGWVGRVRRQGLAVIVAVALWGAGITAFGLAGPRLALALPFLAFAGAADIVSAVFRGTILQLSVPDSLRGRLSGVHILVVTGGPRLGDFEAGMVAQAFTPMISVVSGGLACIAGIGLLALFAPELARYKTTGVDSY